MSEVSRIAVRAGFSADFRAVACGRVAATRAGLGMSGADFAVWLGSVLGWAPAPDAVATWEAGAVCPPGDVVMACLGVSDVVFDLAGEAL